MADALGASPTTETTSELYLPRGPEAWREVALAYERESMETVLRRRTFGTTGTGSRKTNTPKPPRRSST